MQKRFVCAMIFVAWSCNFLVRASQSIARCRMFTDHDTDLLRPHTTPIDQLLASNILKNRPRSIGSIVNRLKNKNIDSIDFPRELLLVGRSGTGKTMMGKAIARECGIPFFEFSSLSFAIEGMRALEEAFTSVVHPGQPCIVIINDLEGLTRHHDGNVQSPGLSKLFALMDKYHKSQILFIGTFIEYDDLPNVLRKRFCYNIVRLLLPNQQERGDLIAYNISLYPKLLSNLDRTNDGISVLPIFGMVPLLFDERLSAMLARKTNNYSHRRLENLVLEIYRIARRNQRNGQQFVIEDCCLQALKEFKENARFFEKPWDIRLAEFIDHWGPTIFMVSYCMSILAVIWHI